MTDLVLASLHHLLVFTVFAIFAVEMTLIRRGLDASGVLRLAKMDGAYGGVSVAVLAIGFARAVYGLKGWEYYSTYWVFWAKVLAFLVIGALTIMPTMRILRWRKAASADPAYAVPFEEIAAVRPWLRAQGAVFILIPVLAAMMARGIGY